jgi:hypothetical protein
MTNFINRKNFLEVTSGGAIAGSIGNNAVVSGSIASGSVSRFNIASGAFNSGHIGSGAIGGSAVGTGVFNIASGTLGSFDFGSGVITSAATRRIASGQIGAFHFSSGTIISVARFLCPLTSGLLWNINAEETISGGRAVNISQSGYLRIAMASLSGRQLAAGVVMDNILSGFPANVFVHGAFQFTSGMADYSGKLGRTVLVGRSGQIVTMSGSWNSGGFVTGSGDRFQRVGVVMNSGGFVANVDAVTWSGDPRFVNPIV